MLLKDLILGLLIAMSFVSSFARADEILDSLLEERNAIRLYDPVETIFLLPRQKIEMPTGRYPIEATVIAKALVDSDCKLKNTSFPVTAYTNALPMLKEIGIKWATQHINKIMNSLDCKKLMVTPPLTLLVPFDMTTRDRTAAQFRLVKRELSITELLAHVVVPAPTDKPIELNRDGCPSWITFIPMMPYVANLVSYQPKDSLQANEPFRRWLQAIKLKEGHPIDMFGASLLISVPCGVIDIQP